jgi:hypothetical protein
MSTEDGWIELIWNHTLRNFIIYTFHPADLGPLAEQWRSEVWAPWHGQARQEIYTEILMKSLSCNRPHGSTKQIRDENIKMDLGGKVDGTGSRSWQASVSAVLNNRAALL